MTKFKREMRIHMVYAELIRWCLILDAYELRLIREVWGLEDREVVRRGIVSAPTVVFNLIACAHLAQEFGDLSDVAGFYLLRGCWRLDIDEKLAARGLIIPVRDMRMRIVALRIFRHVRDRRPFPLRVRGGERPVAS